MSEVDLEGLTAYLLQTYRSAYETALSAMSRKHGIEAMLAFQECKTVAEVLAVLTADTHWANIARFNANQIQQHVEIADAHQAFKAMEG